MKKTADFSLLIIICLFFFHFQTSSSDFLTEAEDSNLELLEIDVITPENTTYADVDLVLSCEFSKEITEVSFSLDGKENVTFVGDVILTDLSAGEHQLIVYAQYLSGNIGASEVIIFTIKPYPSILVIISLAMVGLVGLCLIISAIRQKD